MLIVYLTRISVPVNLSSLDNNQCIVSLQITSIHFVKNSHIMEEYNKRKNHEVVLYSRVGIEEENCYKGNYEQVFREKEKTKIMPIGSHSI